MSTTRVMFTHADKTIDKDLPYSANNRRLRIVPRIGECVRIMNKHAQYITCEVINVIHGISYDEDDDVAIEIILVTFDSNL